MILAAEIVNTHGTRGEVKALHYTDGESFFKKVKTLYKKDGSPVKINGWRFRKGGVLLSLEGVEDMTAAEKLRFTKLYVREEDLPPLPEGEHYFFQLNGLDGVLPDGTVFGTVTDVIESASANLLEFTKTNGAKVLIPKLPVFVDRVELENKKIYITPIEGLMDNEI